MICVCLPQVLLLAFTALAVALRSPPTVLLFVLTPRLAASTRPAPPVLAARAAILVALTRLISRVGLPSSRLTLAYELVGGKSAGGGREYLVVVDVRLREEYFASGEDDARI